MAVPAVAQEPYPELFGYDRPSMPNDVLTSYAAATAWQIRYTDVIDCRDAQLVGFNITISGCGATSVAATCIEWLQEDFNEAGARWTVGTNGYPLTSGWSFLDTATTVGYTVAGSYCTTSVTKAPFCRLGFRQLTADDGDVLFRISHFFRYNHPYEIPNDQVAVDDVIAGDDVISGDDVTVGDDLSVGDDAGITGLLTVGETLGVTGNVTFSDELSVSSGATTLNDLTSTNITVNDELTVTSGNTTLEDVYADDVNATGVITTTLDVNGDVTVDTSVTVTMGIHNFLLLDVDGTSWVTGLGHIYPTTGTTQITTGSIPLNIGDIIDRVGVRYAHAAQENADDMRISVWVTDGDGTVSHLATATSGSCYGAVLYCAEINRTIALGESLLISLAAKDDDVLISSVEAVLDRRRIGNP
jgi:hypothetical protein